MFGIEDWRILLAYMLCIVSAIVCVVFGLLNWNRGDEPVAQEDLKWVVEEQKVEEEL